MERYGLFKKFPDGSPLWVCAENDLAEVTNKMRDLDRQTGLEHFVHDFRTGTMVATSRDGEPSESRQSASRASRRGDITS